MGRTQLLPLLLHIDADAAVIEAFVVGSSRPLLMTVARELAYYLGFRMLNRAVT